jgi:hypothetical protein
MVWWIALTSLVAVIFAPACSSQECTLIGCADSLQVWFTGAPDKPGLYQIEVVADGVPASCQLAVPHTCGTQASCSGGPSNWRLSVSACGPGQAPQSINGFIFYKDAPTSFVFVVRRDDVVVGGGSAQPTYRESRPNGLDCDPVCRQAPDIHAAIAP